MTAPLRIIALVLLAGTACLRDHPTTPLAVAAVKGDVDTVVELLDAGADVNEVDLEGHTALLWVARDGPPDALAVLVDAGADLDAGDSRPGFGWTPLITAIHTGGLGTIEALLALGADPNLAAPDGRTALWTACAERHDHGGERATAVQALLDHGARPSDRDLTVTVAVGDGVAVRALLEVDPDLKLTEDIKGKLAAALVRLRGDGDLLERIDG